MAQLRLFNTHTNHTDLLALGKRCTEAFPEDQIKILDDLFSLVSWKIKKSNECRRCEQNPDWVMFAKLAGAGGYTDAARMLCPIGYYLTICENPTGTASVEMTALPNSGKPDSDTIHTANTVALAICAAAIEVHILTTKHKSAEEEKPKPVVPPVTNSDHTRYTIWSEGYAIAGAQSKAQILGVAEGATFKDAVIAYAQTDVNFNKYFNADNMTHWGCRLYDNEEEARKVFG